MERIVFLDEGTIGPGVHLGRPAFAHTWSGHQRTAPEDVVARLEGASIAITNKVPLTAETLAALPDLKFIAVAATGFNIVDIAACQSRGIPVSNIRGYAVNTVPEHTFALILALRRNLVEYRQQVLDGAWVEADQFCFFNRPIRDLAGSTLGIIGAGALGQSVGKIGRGFGMEVIYCDAYAPAAPDTGPLVSLETLRDTADVVTLHCPLTDETAGMIGADFLRQMKDSAILINTARGGLIDEPALAEAIQSGQIAGAGIDVTPVEPPPMDSTIMVLAAAPNFILSPHVAWASVGGMQTLSDQLIGNIEAFVAGTPRNLVT
ncbi:MAG: D-2-hydroxyacid dehydrogenase [Pseudomonadota bacterium]